MTTTERSQHRAHSWQWQRRLILQFKVLRTESSFTELWVNRWTALCAAVMVQLQGSVDWVPEPVFTRCSSITAGHFYSLLLNFLLCLYVWQRLLFDFFLPFNVWFPLSVSQFFSQWQRWWPLCKSACSSFLILSSAPNVQSLFCCRSYDHWICTIVREAIIDTDNSNQLKCLAAAVDTSLIHEKLECLVWPASWQRRCYWILVIHPEWHLCIRCSTEKIKLSSPPRRFCSFTPICLFVSRIMQKLLNRFLEKLEGWDTGQERTHWIVSQIQTKGQIQNFSFFFLSLR